MNTPHPSLIDCPKCRNTMRPGVVKVHGTLLGFLMVGASLQNLWFYPDERRRGEDKKTKVIDSGDSRHALSCDTCGTLVILET